MCRWFFRKESLTGGSHPIAELKVSAKFCCFTKYFQSKRLAQQQAMPQTNFIKEIFPGSLRNWDYNHFHCYFPSFHIETSQPHNPARAGTGTRWEPKQCSTSTPLFPKSHFQKTKHTYHTLGTPGSTFGKKFWASSSPPLPPSTAPKNNLSRQSLCLDSGINPGKCVWKPSVSTFFHIWQARD